MKAVYAEWLTRDPLRERIGPNLYDFVKNDPINLLDPLGLCPCKGGALGAINVTTNSWRHANQAKNKAAPSFLGTETALIAACPCSSERLNARSRPHPAFVPVNRRITDWREGRPWTSAKNLALPAFILHNRLETRLSAEYVWSNQAGKS
jgi:hypothetical protein